MGEKYVVALDQGTTSCRTIVFDSLGRTVAQASREFRQIYPEPGWVEHDAMEIWECQLATLKDALADNNISPDRIASIGITNQRETLVVWNRNTGKPIYNAIVWQCRRTANICEELKKKGMEDIIHKKTGLVIDAYFSATKLYWLLNQVPGARAMAVAGELLAGTIDTWLIWNLTGGKVHATDYSNASRTMFFNINELYWDDDLLETLEIPVKMLPQVKDSSGYFGSLDKALLGHEIPITGVAGDQHAALFGQACFDKGMVKNTYGTGCFILMNTGEERKFSTNNLLTTIAWRIGGKVEYALEGSVFSAGAAVQWLRDELQIIKTAAETEDLALAVDDTNGVYMVPAFVGLGAPYWDPYARGAVLGLTRGANKKHLVRAVLESIAYQSMDILDIMEKDSGIDITQLRVDGGASANSFLMQFQADISGLPVIRPENTETTAMGAAFLAGLEVGVWQGKKDIVAIWKEDQRFLPRMDQRVRDEKYRMWKRAVSKSTGWIKA
ncbi:MAG: glycerol kinase GlpK [Clostridiales bacterium]|nr:glycerol kinase GlpK [Clostridiales bacterium]